MLFLGTVGDHVPNREYEIEPFLHQPGIYYEQIGKLRIVRNTWKLITRTDISPLYDQEQGILPLLATTRQRCPTQTVRIATICDLFNQAANKILQKISLRLGYIDELSGEKRRARRGLINGIGSISKTLFGTMDADDEQVINTKLQYLKNENNKIKKTIIEQTQLVDTNLKIFNSTVRDIDENQKMLANAVKRLNELIDANFNEGVARDDAERQLTLISLILETLLDDANQILQFVMDIQKGIINPSVLSPAKILGYLREALSHLPQGKSFPLPLSEENIPLLIETMEVSAISQAKTINVILKIPLVETQFFELQRIYPVPVRALRNTYTFIDVRHKYAIVDSTLRDYVILSDADLSKCKQIPNQYLCANLHPIVRIKEHTPCEIRLAVLPTSKPVNCPTKIIHLNHTIFITLESSNSWIFVAPQQENLAITCANKATKRVTLLDTGIIRINAKCEVATSDFSFETPKLYTQEIRTSYSPTYNLTLPDIHIDTIPKIIEGEGNHLHLHKVIDNLDALNSASASLNKIKEKLNEENVTDDDFHYKLIPSYSVSVFALIVALAVVAFIYIKRVCRTSKHRAPECKRVRIEPESTKIYKKNSKSNP